MTDSKPNVTFITKALFWRPNNGSWARTKETIEFLSEQTNLQIVLLGSVSEQDISLIQGFEHHFNLHWLGRTKNSQQLHWKKEFLELIEGKPIADFYIVEKIENSFMNDVIPRSAKTILDTQDIISHRTSKLSTLGIDERFPLTEEQEIDILRQYDAVICIQQNEHEIIAKWIGNEKALYMPMHQTTNAQSIRNIAKNIAMIGSTWHANVNGLREFFEHVWPKLDSNVELHIYGNICNHFDGVVLKNVWFHGFTPNLETCYKNSDIMINPVYYGSGLKIKSIEALAHGVPLITTPEGASGLEHLDNSSLLIAKTAEEYAQKIMQLVNDRETREKLAHNGLDHIKKHHNKQACFKQLSTYLGAGKASA